MQMKLIGQGRNAGVTFHLRSTDYSFLTNLNGLPIADTGMTWVYSIGTMLVYKDLKGLSTEECSTFGIFRKVVAHIMPNIRRSRFKEELLEGLLATWENGDCENGAWVNTDIYDDKPLSDMFEISGGRGGRGDTLNFLLNDVGQGNGPSEVHLRATEFLEDYNEADEMYHRVLYRFEAPYGTTPVPRISPSFDSLDTFWKQKNNYSFRPEYEFLTLDRDLTHVFFGMELEVSTRLSMTEIQYIVTEVEPKQQPFFYGKQDSSISGRYFNLIELVTMPCTPRFLKKNWRMFFDKLRKLIPENQDISDYFDTSDNLSNGLHIHIGNDAFIGFDTHRGRYNTGDSVSLHNNRFLTAFNQWTPGFQSWLQKVSRRPMLPSASSYCHVHRSFDGKTLARRIKTGSERNRTDRHSACHNNGTTTEVRVWQGIFDLEHIFACIELTTAALGYTMYGNSRLNSRTFARDFTNYVEKQQGFIHAKEVLRSCA